jgi:1,4-alpha-glucan branching enzyme
MLADGLASEWLGAPRRQPEGVPVVLWVGRLLPLKAPTLALEAIAELRRTMRVRLIVAGDGPMLEEMRSKVESLGLSEDVDLLGRVPWATVKELYDSASVLLFTSLRDSSSSQFLEALGRGLPAVALDHHGIADCDVGSAAIKVPVEIDPENLHQRVATALRSVLSDENWESRSVDAVQWASGHVWPAKAAAASRIYEEVVANRGSSDRSMGGSGR